MSADLFTYDKLAINSRYCPSLKHIEIQNSSLNIILPNVKYLSNYVQRERNSVVLFYGNLTLQKKLRPIFKQQKSYFLTRLMDWWTVFSVN